MGALPLVPLRCSLGKCAVELHAWRPEDVVTLEGDLVLELGSVRGVGQSDALHVAHLLSGGPSFHLQCGTGSDSSIDEVNRANSLLWSLYEQLSPGISRRRCAELRVRTSGSSGSGGGGSGGGSGSGSSGSSSGPWVVVAMKMQEPGGVERPLLLVFAASMAALQYCDMMVSPAQQAQQAQEGGTVTRWLPLALDLDHTLVDACEARALERELGSYQAQVRLLKSMGDLGPQDAARLSVLEARVLLWQDDLDVLRRFERSQGTGVLALPGRGGTLPISTERFEYDGRTKTRHVARLPDGRILFTTDSCAMLVRIRPGWEQMKQMLRRAEDSVPRFDIHIKTAAISREYAMQVVSFLDPHGQLIPVHKRSTHVFSGADHGCKSLARCLSRSHSLPIPDTVAGRTPMPLGVIVDDTPTAWLPCERGQIMPNFFAYNHKRQAADMQAGVLDARQAQAMDNQLLRTSTYITNLRHHVLSGSDSLRVACGATRGWHMKGWRLQDEYKERFGRPPWIAQLMQEGHHRYLPSVVNPAAPPRDISPPAQRSISPPHRTRPEEEAAMAAAAAAARRQQQQRQQRRQQQPQQQQRQQQPPPEQQPREEQQRQQRQQRQPPRVPPPPPLPVPAVRHALPQYRRPQDPRAQEQADGPAQPARQQSAQPAQLPPLQPLPTVPAARQALPQYRRAEAPRACERAEEAVQTASQQPAAATAAAASAPLGQYRRPSVAAQGTAEVASLSMQFSLMSSPSAVAEERGEVVEQQPRQLAAPRPTGSPAGGSQQRRGQAAGERTGGSRLGLRGQGRHAQAAEAEQEQGGRAQAQAAPQAQAQATEQAAAPDQLLRELSDRAKQSLSEAPPTPAGMWVALCHAQQLLSFFDPDCADAFLRLNMRFLHSGDLTPEEQLDFFELVGQQVAEEKLPMLAGYVRAVWARAVSKRRQAAASGNLSHVVT